MIISKNWLQDFVNLSGISSQELFKRFTLGCAEVEELEEHYSCFSKITVALIEKITPHPDSDRLNLVTFSLDMQGTTHQVVCGAANVAVGKKVPYCPVGVTLPNGLHLEPKKIRGVLSEGMLLSEEELGLAEKSEGLLILPDHTPVGIGLDQALSLRPDALLHLDNKSLTHRPDLWGHVGIARECAVIFERPLKIPYFTSEWKNSLYKKIEEKALPSSQTTIKVSVDSPHCLSFIGILVEGVKLGESLPLHKTRLQLCGQKSLNNLVDISNYLMLELGHPVHFYDADTIEGKELFIENVKNTSSLKLLDDSEKELLEGDILIRDSKKSLVLAGIMGGKSSGISEKTTRLFIEVANWTPKRIRQTSVRLGLRTESSSRFEKHLDCHQIERVLLRAVELLEEQFPEGLRYHAPVWGKRPTPYIPKAIPICLETLQNRLGHRVSKEQVVALLTGLQMTVQEKTPNTFEVFPPSFRATKDISLFEDIVEEIGRLIGFDTIVPQSPTVPLTLNSRPSFLSWHRGIADFWSFQKQSTELQLHPLLGEKILHQVDWMAPLEQNRLVFLKNGLSLDQQFLRPSLLPALLISCRENAKNFSCFRFFEIGKIYKKDQETNKEETHLGIIFFKETHPCILDLANAVEDFLRFFSIPYQLSSFEGKWPNTCVDSSWRGINPYQALELKLFGKLQGIIGSLHPTITQKLKIKGHVSFASISLEDILQKQPFKKSVTYSPISKAPSSNFDFTLKTALNFPLEEAILWGKKFKCTEMISFGHLVTFTKEEDKFLTFRATFAHPQETLSSEFLQKKQQELMQHFVKAGYTFKE